MLPEVKVFACPIGGFPPEIFHYHGPDAVVPEEDARTPQFQHHVALYNAFMDPDCVAARSTTNDTWLCLLPYIAYPHMTEPIFIIEAFTDTVVVMGFEGVPADPKSLLIPAVRSYFTLYGANASKNFEQVQLNSGRDGLYAASCLTHTDFRLDKPLINGTNAVTAASQWIQAHLQTPNRQLSQNFFWVDKCLDGKYFPACNGHCPPITKP